MKKLLTIDDLFRFCEEHNFSHFSSKAEGYPLTVQIPATYEIQKSTNEDGLLRLKFRILHIGKNRNGSYMSEESVEKHKDSFKNRPILANIHQLDDGSWDFGSHDFEIVEEDGEERIEYIERQVGSFTEDELWYETDDETGLTYLCGYGVIPEDYTRAADIIREKGWTKNSCEIEIEEMRFNAKDKYLDLIDWHATASTLLGTDVETGDEVQEGMLGARADIADFSKTCNSIFSQENIVTMLVELKEQLSALTDFEINHNPKKKGGENVAKKEFEAEDAAVEVAEATEQTEDVAAEEATSEEVVAEEVAEETAEETIEDEPKDDEVAEESTEEVSEEDTEVAEESTEEVAEGEVAETAETFSRTFELSHDDVRCGLYALLSQFEEEDNDWYGIVEVYDNYFVYQGMFDASHTFKQEYTKDGDAISFTGERVHLNAEYLTDNELAELNAMRSNYSEVTEKLAKYEAEPQKVEKIESEEYSMIRDTEEYQKVAADHFDLSVEDITKALDDAVLKYAKANKLNYATKEEETSVARKLFAVNVNAKRSGKYDSLFSK